MTKLLRYVLGILALVALCANPMKAHAQEQDGFDFQLATEEIPYPGHVGEFIHPLIIQGNDSSANYSVDLEGCPNVHHTYEGTLQINPQLVEEQRVLTIIGTSSNGQEVVKKYRVEGTYLSGYQIMLLEDKEPQSEETVEGKGSTHEHLYELDYIKKPTKWSDGTQAKICVQCGDATDLAGVSGAHVFLEETYKQIEAAGAGETIRLEFGTYNSLPPELIEKIAEKNDVTYQIHFLYQNVNYDYTIERGSMLETGAEWYGPEKLIQTFHGCASNNI